MKKLELFNPYKGCYVRTLRAQGLGAYSNFIRDDSFGVTGVIEKRCNEMKQTELFNAYNDGNVRTIKAQYNKTSFANLIRGDSLGATGVIEMKVKNKTKKGYIECPIGGAMDLAFPDSNDRRGRVVNNGQTTNTLDTGCNIGVNVDDVRIRKLTPKECFRLQGFPDDYFERAQSVCSDSQLYKQAGNSVTVNVIYEIAKRLTIEEGK